MFTGIIKAIGTVVENRSHGGDSRLRIEAATLPWCDYAAGDSIAVNGVCLTADSLATNGFTCDVSSETLSVTTLGNLKVGSKVNLEPSLALSDRLGGHMVSGHVDGIGSVTSRREEARSIALRIDVPAPLRRYLAAKGSICVDGVSLTINAVSGRSFTANIIPHTARETIVGEYRSGTQVNIEVDLVARYLESLLRQDDGEIIDRSYLEANGYA